MWRDWCHSPPMRDCRREGGGLYKWDSVTLSKNEERDGRVCVRAEAGEPAETPGVMRDWYWQLTVRGLAVNPNQEVSMMKTSELQSATQWSRQHGGPAEPAVFQPTIYPDPDEPRRAALSELTRGVVVVTVVSCESLAAAATWLPRCEYPIYAPLSIRATDLKLCRVYEDTGLFSLFTYVWA